MATYHISPNGNDANNGLTPATAWKTIARFDQIKYSLAAGDQVLFERGGTYQGNITIGSSGTAASPIVIGAYGVGALPKITGAKKLTSWTLHSGNIWKTSVTEEVKYLYQNDEMLKIARWPNEGFMTNDLATNTSLYDAALTQPDGYFNGASITVRTSAWAYYTVNVKNYNAKTLYFETSINASQMTNRAWGYFLTNKLVFLDSEGEWFFDKATGILYAWPKGGVDPNTQNFEAATVKTNDEGILTSSNRQYINISDLHICKYTKTGVHFSGPYNRVERCEIDNCYVGFNIYGNSNVVKNNELHDTYATGVLITGGESNLVEDNNLVDIAIRPGLGENAWGYMGLRISGSKTVIRGNTLDTIGYIGITLDSDQVCENNFITNACHILNDGSGIAFDNANGLVIRNNIVMDVKGNIDGVPPNYEGAKPKGNGIYFGNTVLNNVTVLNNTVGNCNGSGIWVDHVKTSSGNVIEGNTLFNNTLCQIGFSDWSNNESPAVNGSHGVPAYNDIVRNNISYCDDAQQLSMYQINAHYNGVDFGTFTNNTLSNPFKQDHIKRDKLVVGQNNTYTLAAWQAATGEEVGSSSNGGTSTNPTDHILIYNDQNADAVITLPAGVWSDVKSITYNGEVTLAPFTSKVLFKTAATAPATITNVTAASDRSILNEGTTALLTAVVEGTGAFNNAVTWSIVSGGGTLSSISGAQVTYTAPMVDSDVTAIIKATSVADATKSSAVQMTVRNTATPTITSVVVTATPSTVNEKTASQLTAVVNGTGAFNNAVTWQILNGGIGTISSTVGQTITYTAPSVNRDRTTRIRATAVDNTSKYGTVTLVIKNVTTPTITSVTVAASPSTISAGATSTLTATVAGTGSFNNGVTWMIVSGGGTLSSTSGGQVTYTAPTVATQQTVVIRATSVGDTTKNGTTNVTVNPVVGTVTSVTTSPASSTINEGGTIGVSASVQGTGPFTTGVVWSIVSGGGTLSSTATNPVTYTAPMVSANSTAVLRATSTFDASKFGETTVSINDVAVPPPVAGLNIPAAEMGVVINADDPSSQAIATEFITRWGIPAANVKTVNLGNADSAGTSAANTARQAVASSMPSSVQWLALCFNRPSRVNSDNSITWVMTVGYNTISLGGSSLPTNPIFGYTGKKPFTDKGVRPSMLVTSTALVQKAKAAHGTQPKGTCYMLAANDQSGQPRGRSRLSQMTALNGSTSYSGVSFSYTSNLSGPGGENAANNILNKPDMLFYFNGMYKIYGMETNTLRAGAVGDYVTSTSGNLPSGAGQTPISYMIDNGFVGTMGTVTEPWQDIAGASPGSLVEQFTNIQTFMPLYHGGRSLVDAYWKSIKWPTRSLILGDPMVAPWGTGGGSGPTPVMGCTDPTATNYNPNATINDGSCVYPPSAVKWATSFDGSGPTLIATVGTTNIGPARDWSNGAFAGGSITTNSNTSYPWTLGSMSKVVLKGVTFLATETFSYTKINSHFTIRPDGSVVFALNGVNHSTGVVLVKGQKYASLELPVPAVGANVVTAVIGGPVSTGSSCQMTLEGMEIYG